MKLSAPISLFLACGSISVLIFISGCDSAAENKPTLSQQVEQLTQKNSQLQSQLKEADYENKQLKRQIETLSMLPGSKRAENLYQIKQLKIGRFTNIYEDQNSTGQKSERNLMVYVEPIDETGDTIKAAGEVEVQLWDLSKKGNENKLAQWQVGANELKRLWLRGLLSASYRLSFDVSAIIEQFDKPLTLRVSFTDYLSGTTFTEDFIIKPLKINR